MAKKKAEEQQVADDFTDRVFAETEKDFGKGVMIGGNEAVNEAKRVIIPWCPSLDTITSGGVEEGSWVGVTGNEKTTKTSAILSFCVNAQKPEYGSRPVFYHKVEGRLSLHHLQGIKGLDLSNFYIIGSHVGKILTAQDHLKIALNTLRTVPKAIVVMDSISALCNEDAMNDGLDGSGGGMAADARLFSRFLQLSSNLVPTNRCIFFGVTQLISNIKPGGAQYSEKAARRWKYQCDYQMRTIVKTAWKAGETQIGLIIKWACNTSPLGPPGMTIDSYFRFGTGQDRLYELIVFGMGVNLIKKAGSWLTLSYLEKDEHKHLLSGAEAPKCQGGEKIYAMLLDKPEWANVLEKEVLSLAIGLAGSEAA